MKNKISVLVYLMISFAITSVNAQSNTTGSQPAGASEASAFVSGNAADNSGALLRDQMDLINRKGVPVNVEGSPYMVKAFTKATIHIEDRKDEVAFVRYNAHLDHLEIKMGKKVYQLRKNESMEIDMNGKKFQLMQYHDGNNRETGYLLLLAEGELSFYMKPAKLFKAEKKAETPYDDDEPARYIDNYSYYLKKGEGDPQKVKINKSLLKDLFGAAYKEAMEYAKDNNLNRKDPYDLGKLIDWYNDQL